MSKYRNTNCLRNSAPIGISNGETSNIVVHWQKEVKSEALSVVMGW